MKTNHDLQVDDARYGHTLVERPSVSTSDLWNSARTLHAVEFGRANSERPIVLLHGLGGSHRSWYQIADHLNTGHRYIAVDIPGFGESQGTADGLAMASVGRVILDALDQWSVREAVFVGHSMGSLLGLDIAAKGGRAAAGVVVMSGPLVNVLTIYHDPFGALQHEPLATMSYGLQLLAAGVPWPRPLIRLALRNQVLRSVLLQRFVASPALLSDPVLDALSLSIGGTAAWQAARNGIGYDYEEEYRKITAPVAIVRGSADGLIGRSDLAQFADLVEVVDEIVVEGAAHWMSYEDPIVTAEALNLAIESINSRGTITRRAGGRRIKRP